MSGSPIIHPISKPPGFHWFSYYDKLQFDPTDRYLLGMKVDFEHRLPTGNDVISVGMFDLADNNQWIELGQSRAWCWQQGCMLQWRPGSDCEIVWNDRKGDQYVSRVLDIETGATRTLPRALGTISPDGKLALCEDFSRIWDFRPGYGYPGIPDRYANKAAPAECGIWRMDMDTGEARQLVSIGDLVQIPFPGQTLDDRHYVNHLSWDPSGERFLMFNRWFGGGQPTRVFTMASDGSELRLLSAQGASHWAWRDPQHVLIWGFSNLHPKGAYQLFRDNGSGFSMETVWEYTNGHQTYIPGRNSEWLITDTYPQAESNLQELCLFHIPSKRKISLGNFYAPLAYRGDLRCDLHPRLSRSGTKVVIDSTHGGEGRQMYLVDIEKVLAEAVQQ